MAYSNLTTGSSGEEVKKLQTQLINAGYDLGASGADGVYGEATQAAVSKYQQDNGLDVDGIAGEQTQSKLYGASSTSGGNAAAAPQANTQSTQQVATGVTSQYDPSGNAAYQEALAALQAASQNAPSYAGTYEGQLQDLYSQIVNRDKFSYDINEDMLYRQYAQQYQQSGNLAMQDTIGQAAGLTGGYGSSYGQAVGQQQYDAYLQQLNDVIPELYGMAYDRYQAEGDQLAQQYAMLGDLRDQEYGQYQDAYSRWLAERESAQSRADAEYERGYNEWQDEYSLAMKKASDLAEAGDFSGYAELYGNEAAENMRTSWISSNPDLAYRNGLISAEDYKSITGSYPAGYKAPTAGGGGGGGGGTPKPDAQTATTPTFATYSEAVAYMRANGVTGSAASGIMTQAEWVRRKNGGSSAVEVKNYSSYKDYLNDVVQYKIETKSK